VKRQDIGTAERMVEELKGAARTLGFEVREEELLREVGYRARSGACRIGEQRVIFLDRALSPADRVEVLSAALAGHDLESVFLSPALRARLNQRREVTEPPD
jgi:sulfur carrier protein ThiS